MPPQKFELSVFDNYQTRDPNAPLTGTDVQGTVNVTINWDASGFALSDQDVQFGDPEWLETGNGPLGVYEQGISDLKPVGTVAWTVATHTMKVTETDTPGKRQRLAITPVVQLIRTFTPNDGTAAVTLVAYTASDTVRGTWMPQATS